VKDKAKSNKGKEKSKGKTPMSEGKDKNKIPKGVIHSPNGAPNQPPHGWVESPTPDAQVLM
jgi:hypothetical protein